MCHPHPVKRHPLISTRLTATGCLVMLLLLAAILSKAQTPVNGMIDADTVLRKVNSPYIVASDLVISPNGSLTIEGGVEIIFSSNVKLEVRGKLTAIGAASDSITFTSTSPTPGSWYGIDIKNNLGGNGTFSYCYFSYAQVAINEECCWGARDSVSHSSFVQNLTAMGGYTGHITPIDSCYFSSNVNTITQADKNITNAVFENNTYGLANTERVNVSNSIFKNHTEVALLGGRGNITNCVIEENNIGVKNTAEGFTISNSSISNNSIGIELSYYNVENAPITNNKICNNTTFNVVNKAIINADLYKNCWCNADSTVIEDKLWDGIDSTGLGFISYDIYNTTCDTVISTVDKTKSRTIVWTPSNSPYLITKNFIVHPNDTLRIEPGVEVRFEENIKLDLRGTLIAMGSVSDSITFTSTSPTPGSWYGIDIKNNLGGNGTFSYCYFSYAQVAINEECCWGARDSVSHSSFVQNLTAMGGYTGHITPIDSCYFSSNVNTITQADKNITNAVFENNTYGLANTERVNVSNSIFKNHTEVALLGGRGNITNCVIEENNIGVKNTAEGFTISNSSISNNSIGIELSYYNVENAPITNNKICNNTTFNVKNTSSVGAALFDNCWCSADSTTVENKILDGWDQTALGLVDYMLYSANCETPLFKTDKANGRVTYFVTHTDPSLETQYKLYPNPVTSSLFIDNASGINEIVIYDYLGRVHHQDKNSSQHLLQVNLSSLPQGVYLVEIKATNGRSTVHKIMLK